MHTPVLLLREMWAVSGILGVPAGLYTQLVYLVMQVWCCKHVCATTCLSGKAHPTC